MGTASTVGPDLPGMTCVRLIGSGGFADVYLYEQEQPRLPVAVKLIKGDLLDDTKRRQFAAEAQAMAVLAEHPYIVPVLRAGTADDGRPYLVMRYYPFSDLAARVASSPMSVQEALRYGVQLSSAVHTAHVAGIVHRDIKPSNILISSYGQPALSDFGIAGRPNDATEGEDEEIGVSIPWSPREVLVGESNGSVTSDVYSLAATVWNLLVGRAPFYVVGGDNGERATVTRITHSRPPTTGRDDVPASLDRLLQQSLAKDPGHRAQSALELARHFQRIEQELRLSRTEVVVLDQAASVASSVISKQVATKPDLAETADETLHGATPRDPVQGADPFAEGLTSKKPRPQLKAWNPSHTSASAPSGSDSPDPGHDPASRSVHEEAQRPTEFRPRSVGSIQAPTVSQERPPRARRGVLLVAAIGVVVVAVGVGVVLSHGNAPTAKGKDSDAPADTGIEKVLPAQGAGPAAPISVRGAVRGHKVTFTWPAVTGATSYSWTPDSGAGGTVIRARVTVTRAASGPTCVTVSSLETGYPASLGKRACVR